LENIDEYPLPVAEPHRIALEKCPNAGMQADGPGNRAFEPLFDETFWPHKLGFMLQGRVLHIKAHPFALVGRSY
jgi:hypothetical protein